MSEGCSDKELRLRGGRDEREGRVELCYSGIWGTVGALGGWGFEKASGVCSELGYNPLGRERIICLFPLVSWLSCSAGALPLIRAPFGEDGPLPIVCRIDCDGDPRDFPEGCTNFERSGCSIDVTVGVRCDGRIFVCSG